MPNSVTLYQLAVWFCVGFFVGSGWTAGSWITAKILSII